MPGLALETMGTQRRPDGVYEGFRLPTGQVVTVPTLTGFSFIDQQLVRAQDAQEFTRKQPFFELRPEISTSIIRRVVGEGSVPPELGSSAFRNMQLFLRAIAANRGLVLRPSAPVDAMWHEFMQRPGTYLRSCNEAGGLIDHVPDEPAGSMPEGALNVAESFQFLASNGYEPDPSVWPVDSRGDCGGVGCTNGDCTSGGPPRMTQALRLSGVVGLTE
jgi:hypothetical protein